MFRKKAYIPFAGVIAMIVIPVCGSRAQTPIEIFTAAAIARGDCRARWTRRGWTQPRVEVARDGRG